jgi:hypothetical protein
MINNGTSIRGLLPIVSSEPTIVKGVQQSFPPLPPPTTNIMHKELTFECLQEIIPHMPVEVTLG